jgi:hypothetical protein
MHKEDFHFKVFLYRNGFEKTRKLPVSLAASGEDSENINQAVEFPTFPS